MYRDGVSQMKIKNTSHSCLMRSEVLIAEHFKIILWDLLVLCSFVDRYFGLICCERLEVILNMDAEVSDYVVSSQNKVY
jgi:hypothetical protein